MARFARQFSLDFTLKTSQKNSIAQVNEAQLHADEAIVGILTGEQSDVAGTMIAVQKANISFQLMTQVRNKIVEAYEKVMRMPV